MITVSMQHICFKSHTNKYMGLVLVHHYAIKRDNLNINFTPRLNDKILGDIIFNVMHMILQLNTLYIYAVS